MPTKIGRDAGTESFEMAVVLPQRPRTFPGEGMMKTCVIMNPGAANWDQSVAMRMAQERSKPSDYARKAAPIDHSATVLVRHQGIVIVMYRLCNCRPAGKCALEASLKPKAVTLQLTAASEDNDS